MDPMHVLAELGDRGLAAVGAAYVAYCALSTFWNGGGFLYFVGFFLYTTIEIALILALVGGVFAVGMFLLSHWGTGGPAHWEQSVEITDASERDRFKNNKIPMETFIELYINQKANFKGDVLEIMRKKRYEIFQFCFTLNHAPFIIKRFIPVVLSHTQEMDKREVQEVYDRGNDFYNYFLGEMMLYTSGVYESESDTLKQAQINKMNLACRKVHLQEGERLLDIGCGWGTFVCHAAANYKAKCLGITISEQGALYGQQQILEKGLRDSAEIRCLDYRDIPLEKWDKITCFEMAEHVGVKNFQKFLGIVHDRLTDDGIFYLQIAGLRRAWQFEDLLWGLFMNKYIFPGADASTPLAWYIAQCEKAGFEVRSVETIGIHYSRTLEAWYNIWLSNKEKVLQAYGERWFRLWSIFLAWSVIAAGQGSATCYQIVMHKNTSTYNRSKFIGNRV